MARHTLLFGAVVAALLIPATGWGQSPDTPDPNKLPISVARIRTKLRQAPPSNTPGLRLQYYIEVYGKVNPLDLVGEFDLQTGPVPYGAPTHTELIQFVTPQEFRAPAADLIGPTRALLEWLARKRSR